jgi:nucleoside-diphosphate-sugar epimerase
METIGHGFIARHLQPLRGAHPGVTVLAAGVPRHPLPDSEHARETHLVQDTVRRCRSAGQQLVFLSTVSMYGAPGCQGNEDDPVLPSTRYGDHKLGLETLVRESGVRHLILRLGYVLGPHGPDFRLVPALIRQLREGRVRVYRGARRDMIYVTDFVTIVDRLLAANVTDEVVNVASGDCVEIVRVVDHLEQRLGADAERQIVGNSISHCPSVRKLRALVPETARMGFEPGYYRTALDRYLEATQATAPVGGRPSTEERAT